MRLLGLQVRFKAKQAIRCAYEHPLEGVMKLNCDKSKGTNRAGYGGLVRDERGETILAYTGGNKVRTVLEQENTAIMEGMMMCVEKGDRLQVCSDSQLAIDILNRTWKEP